jgi:hypothetical protein
MEPVARCLEKKMLRIFIFIFYNTYTFFVMQESLFLHFVTCNSFHPHMTLMVCTAWALLF